MRDLERELNRIALEKQAEKTENAIAKKAMEKEAAAGYIGTTFKRTGERLSQGWKKFTGETGKQSKGFKGTGEAFKKDLSGAIKKNPLAYTGGAAGAAYLAGRSGDKGRGGKGGKGQQINVYTQSRVRNYD